MVLLPKNELTFISDESKNNRNLLLGLNKVPEEMELRFGIGANVMANVGEFAPGIIRAQWDEGNAYRIELLDDAKTNVWAPVDHDTFVRARSSGDDKRAQLLNTSDS